MVNAMGALLWYDEAGFVISTELVLIASLLVLGMVVGLQTVRDAVTTELADQATALGHLNQSFSMGGVAGHASSISGTTFQDVADFGDNATFNVGSSGTAGITFHIPAAPEAGS